LHYTYCGDNALKIADFIWLEEIVEKLEVKHGVVPEEVEEIFANRPRITRMERGAFKEKTFTGHWARRTQDVTLRRSLSTNEPMMR
jgi:hypothetical protein